MILRSRLRIIPSLISLLAVASCAGDDAPPAPSGQVGALLITADTAGVPADRATFTITGDDLAAPITGELAVIDGVVTGQLQVPEGARTVELTVMNGSEIACAGRARDLAISAGFTSQVAVVARCGADLAPPAASARNSAPRIEAVFATRKNVTFGERVAISVSAFDADGDRLRYAWTESVAGFGFDDATAAATSWKAGPKAVGENRLRITVSDGRRGTDTAELRMSLGALADGAGTCAQPTRIRLGDRVRGFTLGKTAAQESGLCTDGAGQGNAPEHVFRLELTERTTVSFSTAGSAFNVNVYVRRGACGDPAAEVVCDSTFSNAVELIDAEPGTYYVIVDGRNGLSRGEFQLAVNRGRIAEQCFNGVDDDGDGALDCADTDCATQQGCLTCVFDCDPSPDDCFGGSCNSFNGACDTFPLEGNRCDTDGNPTTAEVCVSGDCVPSTAVCGNGAIEPGEQCDDGNTTSGDGCDATCQIVPVCGNRIAEFPEECDDGNTAGGDGCDASCRFERCGDNICDDGNACTVETCAEPAAGTCQTTNVADGTACDADGIPETVDSCRAGACVQPAPDKALIILEPEVLADPAFSLAAMHDRLAVDGDGAALFDSWATTLTDAMTVNGRTAAARPGFTRFFEGLARDVEGRVDLDQAGFLPSAMVNRFDLRTPGTCGENRLVFTKTSGVTNGSDRMTIIFEFAVPDDGSNCQNALARWTALRALGGDALRQASAALLRDFARPERLNQMRTNEFIAAGIWELREFHLIAGVMTPVPVADSVPPSLAQDPEFRSFVLANLGPLNAGGHELPFFPARFLAASSLADGARAELGNLVPSLPGLTSNVNIRACAGCHLTETGTGFVHVAERTAEQPSQLSTFMRSELSFRVGDLERFLGSSAPRL
jgi:cysteine-rich repeat protein